jgi:pimeloyl-ACP methyl ester carboxylesterase
MYRPTNFFSYEELTTRQFEPIETNNNDPWRYRLAFIEFDDRGEMFKRAQLDRAVREIAKARADAKVQGRRAVLAVFVHGWKNNASETSGNVWGFRQVLAGVAKQYDNAPVIGVYIGWRGAVLSPPILKEFTIFDRYQKSQNLPGAHLVEALLKILQAAKGADYDDPGMGTVLMGHSLGGAVLETALTQTLLGMAIKAKAAGTRVHWPADLILFVNEAQEATRSYQLIEAFAANLPPRDPPEPGETLARPAACLPPADSSQTEAQQDRVPEAPVIVSISSTGDAATRVAFTGFQAVQRPLNSLRSYDADDPNILGFKRQTPMFLHTTAHSKEFQTHLMGRCRCEGETDPDTHRCLDEKTLVCEDPAVEEARKACKVNVETTLSSTTYLIVEKPGAKNRTPYWVLHMPTTVVPDHSTIFTPVFRNFIITLLNRALASASISN